MRMYKLIAIVVLGATFSALTFAAPAFSSIGSGFVTWGQVTGEPGNSGATSPHGGYATNTVKCAVCHAVHNAQSGGEVLLRTTVAAACTYCHIDTGNVVSTMKVYGGTYSNYTVDTPYGHQSWNSGNSGVKCEQCHQVHAAGDHMTLNTQLTRKILIGAKVQDLLDPYYDPRVTTAPNNTDSKETALTKWCTRCHKSDGDPGSNRTYYTPWYSDGGHVLKAIDASGYAGDGPSAQGMQVAWASSEYCSSCHAKGYGTSPSQWPHWTTSKRFLLSSSDASAASADITGTTATYIDGVCLRCHRAGSLGVGMSY